MRCRTVSVAPAPDQSHFCPQAFNSSISNPPKALLFDVSRLLSVVSTLISSSDCAYCLQVFGIVIDEHKSRTNALATAASEIHNSESASIPDAVRGQASATSWGVFAYKWDEAYCKFAEMYDPSMPFITVSEAQHSSKPKILVASEALKSRSRCRASGTTWIRGPTLHEAWRL